MRLSAGQLDKLSDLCIDIAKGLFLSAIAVPAIATQATFLDSIKTTIAGMLFAYVALRLIEIKEVKLKK